jgi:ATP-binding cassette subfamily G (WHITE) protein 2 (SNQ2)
MVCRRSSIQAGLELRRHRANIGIYDLVDDVMVLDHGITMFYGPRPDAKPFFESLGFQYTEGANVADMLTGVTVPTERKIASGFEGKFPRTAREIRDAYKQTRTYHDMLQLQDYPQTKEAEENTADFIAAVAQGKSKSLDKDSPLTVSALTQVRILAKRQFRQVWGDKLTLGLRQGNTVVQALIMGSLFFDMPADSSGLLLRGGVIFFSTVYHAYVLAAI